jgi:hypothetical protein
MSNTEDTNENDLITVCGNCLEASCWQGEFYCQEYKTAGTIQMTRAALREMGLESPDYWKTDKQLQC